LHTKAYNGERACKDIGDRLQAPYYRSTLDHCWEIGKDVGKLSFVNRTITDWNSFLPSFLLFSYVLLTSSIIKVRRIRWAGYVARMGEKRNAYRLLVGKPEGRRPL
jgi:hypothetical protein